VRKGALEPRPRGQWHLLWNEQKNLKRRVRSAAIGRNQKRKQEIWSHAEAQSLEFLCFSAGSAPLRETSSFELENPRTAR